MKREKIFDHERHHGRENLAGEHIIGDIGQIILLLVFLMVWIGDSFFLHWSTHFLRNIPLSIKIPIAFFILFTSGFLAKKGLDIVFGKVREKPVVICEGVFTVVRHPIYLGCILFYLALLVLSLTVYSLVILIIIIAFYHFLARHEERLLLGKYGEQYKNYMKTVPMWVPSILKKRRNL